MQTGRAVLIAGALILIGYLIVILSFLQSNPEHQILHPGAPDTILKPDESISFPIDADPLSNLRGSAAAAANAPIAASEKSTAMPKDEAVSKEISKDSAMTREVEESDTAAAPKTFHFFKPTTFGAVILGMHRSGTSGNISFTMKYQ
jgi:hypothetical protein